MTKGFSFVSHLQFLLFARIRLIGSLLLLSLSSPPLLFGITILDFEWGASFVRCLGISFFTSAISTNPSRCAFAWLQKAKFLSLCTQFYIICNGRRLLTHHVGDFWKGKLTIIMAFEWNEQKQTVYGNPRESAGEIAGVPRSEKWKYEGCGCREDRVKFVKIIQKNAETWKSVFYQNSKFPFDRHSTEWEKQEWKQKWILIRKSGRNTPVLPKKMMLSKPPIPISHPWIREGTADVRNFKNEWVLRIFECQFATEWNAIDWKTVKFALTFERQSKLKLKFEVLLHLEDHRP